MVAITRDDGFELVEGDTPSSAVSGIVHGMVFVVPLWTIIASVVVVALTH